MAEKLNNELSLERVNLNYDLCVYCREIFKINYIVLVSTGIKQRSPPAVLLKVISQLLHHNFMMMGTHALELSY